MKKKYFFLVLVLINFKIFAQTDSSSNPQQDWFQLGLDEMDKQTDEKRSLQDLLNLSVTTATQNTEKSGQAPATIYVITEEQIKVRNYQSLLDVLYDLPDFKISDRSNENRNNITVRGINGNEKFIILMDGMRISSPTNEPMPIMENYPVYLAKQIEIVYGSASALYGADAVSGVINIITKKATNKDIIEVRSNVGTYGLANTSVFIAKRLGYNISLTVGGQYMYDKQPDLKQLYGSDSLVKLEGMETGSFTGIFGTITPKTPFNRETSFPMSAYNIYANLRIRNINFSIFRNNAITPTAVSNTPNNTIYNSNAFLEQSITLGTISYQETFKKIAINSYLIASKYDLSPNSNFRNVYVGLEPGYKYSTGSMIKLNHQVTWTASEKFNLTAGVTYESFFSIPKGADLESPINQSQEIKGIIIGTRSNRLPNGIDADLFFLNYYNLGTFLQMQYQPSSKISLTLGARYDYNSRYRGTLNPRLGFVWRPTGTTTIKALFGTAFLAPSPFAAYQNYGSFFTPDNGNTYQSFFWRLPNPDLKPILSQTTELSIKQFVGENFSISLNGYYINSSNLFSTGSDADNDNLYNGTYKGWNIAFIEVPVNQGTQTNYGGTFQLDYFKPLSKGSITAYLSTSYTAGTTQVFFQDKNNQGQQNNAEISYISPFIFRLGADLVLGKFSCSPRLILVGEQNMNSFETPDNPLQREKLAGYALLNIALNYKINRWFAVFSTIQNALNQRYRDVNLGDNKAQNPYFFNGAAQNPIRITGGVSVSF